VSTGTRLKGWSFSVTRHGVLNPTWHHCPGQHLPCFAFRGRLVPRSGGHDHCYRGQVPELERRDTTSLFSPEQRLQSEQSANRRWKHLCASLWPV